MQQVRSFCRECKREWLNHTAANSSPVSITGNPLSGDNCPVCGSPEIELVSYDNVPGLDIPRDGKRVILPNQETVESIGRHLIRSDIPKVLLAAQETVASNSVIRDLVVKEEEIKKEEEYNPIYDLSDMD